MISNSALLANIILYSSEGKFLATYIEKTSVYYASSLRNMHIFKIAILR